MSRVFRRPMFRKGGGVNMNGIMSGIEDRQNYQEGDRVSELTEKYTGLLGANKEDKGFDPLTTFLLQYGPAIASQRPIGSGISGAIATGLAAAEKPIGSLLESQAEKRKFERGVKAGATELAIQQAFEEQLQKDALAAKERMLEKQLGAEGDQELKRRTDKYFGTYNDFILAENRARHDIDNIPGQVRNKFGKEQYGGLLEGGDINKQAQKLGKKDNEGKVYYDITDGKTKRLRKDAQTGKFVWEEVSITGEIEEGVGQAGPEDTETNNVKIEEEKIKLKPFGKKEYEESIQKGTDYIMTPRDPESFDISNIRSFRKDF